MILQPGVSTIESDEAPAAPLRLGQDMREKAAVKEISRSHGKKKWRERTFVIQKRKERGVRGGPAAEDVTEEDMESG